MNSEKKVLAYSNGFFTPATVNGRSLKIGNDWHYPTTELTLCVDGGLGANYGVAPACRWIKIYDCRELLPTHAPWTNAMIHESHFNELEQLV